MDMEELIEFLQIKLEQDFGYNDDFAMLALQTTILELQRYRLHIPGQPLPHELPQKPFGLITKPNGKGSFNGNRSFSRSVSSVQQDISFNSLPRVISDMSNHSVVSELSSPSTELNDFPLHRSVSLYDNVDAEESYQAALKQSPVSSRMNSPDSALMPQEPSFKRNYLHPQNGSLVN